MVYRGFSYLRSRVLLTQQRDLIELEEELDEIDKLHFEEGKHRRLKSWSKDKYHAQQEAETEERPRTRILTEIRQKLSEYGLQLQSIATTCSPGLIIQ